MTSSCNCPISRDVNHNAGPGSSKGTQKGFCFSIFEIISKCLSFRNMSVALIQDSRSSQDSSKRFMSMIDPVPLHVSASSTGILKAKWEARTFKTGC